MTVYLDPRVGSRRPGQRSSHDLGGLLTELGVAVEKETLDFGDFWLWGKGPDGPVSGGIGLKAVSGFVTSMQNGRLAGHQVPGLVVRYDRVYLIIEGFYRAKRGSGLLEIPRGGGWKPLRCGPRPVFWADVEKFITGLEEAGIRVRRTRTSHETARVIAHVIAAFWRKDYEEHKSFHVLYKPAPLQLVREDETTRRLREVAACLPAIGWGRSKAVATHFGSIYRMVTAGREQWEGITGIGTTIREEVQQALHAQIPESRFAPSTVPPRRVSARRRPDPRSQRNPGRRQDRQLDAGRRAQRGVSQAHAKRRGAVRREPE